MITIVPIIGDTIHETAATACRLAVEDNDHVTFKFNEITLVVTPGMLPETVVGDYFQQSDARHQAYIASPEYKARQIAAEKAQAEKQAALNDILAKAPAAMTIVNEAGWTRWTTKNKDGYGAAILQYAQMWARIMEAHLTAGAKLEDVAESSSHLADTEGITGFMYGAAVAVLADVWKHGGVLRRWHNKETQIGTEGDEANEKGGVLNPALISIGAKP